MTSLLKKTANWARQNKLKAAACIAFSIAGGSGAALHYVNGATPDEAARDREWQKLTTDAEHLADTDKAYHAVEDFRRVLYGRTGAITAPIDKEKLARDGDGLLTAQLSAQGTLLNDFAVARDLSLNDIGAFRSYLKDKLSDPRDDRLLSDNPFNSDIRTCQNKTIAKTGPDPTAEGAAALMNCLEKEPRQIDDAPLLTLMIIWSSIAGAIPTGILAWQRSGQKRAARAVQTVQQDTTPSPAPEPDPLVLNAPTQVSRPLMLKMKRSLSGFSV
jgi:hypothetical protein